jgi:hypothetical protein
MVKKPGIKPKAKPKPGVKPKPKPVKPKVEQPPYKCETTDEPGVCLRFNRNPATGQYNLPRGGIRMNCADCEYWFD